MSDYFPAEEGLSEEELKKTMDALFNIYHENQELKIQLESYKKFARMRLKTNNPFKKLTYDLQTIHWKQSTQKRLADLESDAEFLSRSLKRDYEALLLLEDQCRKSTVSPEEIQKVRHRIYADFVGANALKQKIAGLYNEGE